jgi:hypothetical protein
MTAVLERVPIDRINAEARDTHFWLTLLKAIAGLLYGIGWVAAKTLGYIWLGLCWAGVAVKVGWVEARKPKALERDTA